MVMFMKSLRKSTSILRNNREYQIYREKLRTSSCDITQKDKDVYLGEHSVAKLKKMMTERKKKASFDISLINCSLAMTSLKIKMEGTAHAPTMQRCMHWMPMKSAGKVGISIATAEGQQITPARWLS